MKIKAESNFYWLLGLGLWDHALIYSEKSDYVYKRHTHRVVSVSRYSRPELLIGIICFAWDED